MTKLDHRLDEAVCHWPRLGYLTKRQKLKTLSHRGDLLPIIPLINRVFPAIKTLRFVETSSSSDRDSSTGQVHVHLFIHNVCWVCVQYM